MFSNIMKKGDHRALPQTEEDAKEMEALTNPNTSIEMQDLSDDEVDEEELEEKEITPVARRNKGGSKKKYLLVASVLVAFAVAASVAVVKMSAGTPKNALDEADQKREDRKNSMFKDLKDKKSHPSHDDKKPKKDKKKPKNDLDVSDMWPKGKGKEEEPSDDSKTQEEKPGKSKEKPADTGSTEEKPKEEEEPKEKPVAVVVSTPESPKEAKKPEITEITERPDYLPEFTWDAIQKDAESPQGKAWTWVQSHPDFGTGTMPTWRTKQLMGLVTVLGTNLANFLRSFNGDYECQWRGFADVPNCTWDGKYQTLNLHGMGLELDAIPPEVSLMPALWSLDLSKNNITGPIPTEIGLVSSLAVLDLSKNSFDSTIPSELGQLGSSLRSMRIHDAKLKGSVPTTLGQLSILEQFRLESNELDGHFPSELGKLSALRLLDLSDNMLSGPLPMEFGRLARVSLIQLQDNMLTGMLNPHFHMSKHGCNLRGNKFSKPIPRDIGCHVV